MYVVNFTDVMQVCYTLYIKSSAGFINLHQFKSLKIALGSITYSQICCKLLKQIQNYKVLTTHRTSQSTTNLPTSNLVLQTAIFKQKGPHKPDAIRQCNAIFKFLDANMLLMMPYFPIFYSCKTSFLDSQLMHLVHMAFKTLSRSVYVFSKIESRSCQTNPVCVGH